MPAKLNLSQLRRRRLRLGWPLLPAPPSQAVPAAMSQVHRRHMRTRLECHLKHYPSWSYAQGLGGRRKDTPDLMWQGWSNGENYQKSAKKTLMRILNRHYKDLWSMMQLWCINVSKVCHLATYQINFQVELLSMIDIQDIFNIRSCRINAGQRAFITLVWKYGII